MKAVFCSSATKMAYLDIEEAVTESKVAMSRGDGEIAEFRIERWIMKDKDLLDAIAEHLRLHPEVAKPDYVPADLDGEARDSERIDEYGTSMEQHRAFETIPSGLPMP